MLDLYDANHLYVTDFTSFYGGVVNKSELVENVAAAADFDKRADNKVSLFGSGTFAPTSRAASTGVKFSLATDSRQAPAKHVAKSASKAEKR